MQVASVEVDVGCIGVGLHWQREDRDFHCQCAYIFIWYRKGRPYEETLLLSSLNALKVLTDPRV